MEKTINQDLRGSQERTQTETNESNCITNDNRTQQLDSRLEEKIWRRIWSQMTGQFAGLSGQPLGGARVPQIKPWQLFFFMKLPITAKIDWPLDSVNMGEKCAEYNAKTSLLIKCLLLVKLKDGKHIQEPKPQGSM